MWDLEKIEDAVYECHKRNKEPKYILLGRAEIEHIEIELENITDYHFTANGAKLHGLEIVAVDRDNFFEVV